MAVYFRHTCSQCGGAAVNNDKTKSYIHLAERQGTKVDHKVPSVIAVRLGEAA